MTIAEKIDAIEKFMDAELLKKRAGRAYQRRGRNSYRIAVEAVKNPGIKVRTSRQYSQSQQSYEYGICTILQGAGIPYKLGNDAPRGGMHGDYVIVN